MAAQWWLVVQDVGLHWMNLLVTAIVVLLVGLLIGRLVGRIISHILEDIEADRLTKNFPIKFSITEFSAKFVEYAIDVIAFFLALQQLRLAKWVALALGLFIAAGIVLSVLFWLKDTIPNILVGWFLSAKKKPHTGDHIDLPKRKIKGKVIKKGITGIIIKTTSKDMYDLSYMVIARSDVKLKRS